MKLYGWFTADKARAVVGIISNQQQMIYGYKNTIMSYIKKECEKGSLETSVDLLSFMTPNEYSLLSRILFEWLVDLGYKITHIKSITGDNRYISISWRK